LVEEGVKCPNCNAPKRARKRRAQAHISGYLPIERILNELTAGFSLEALHGFCGDPSNYAGGTRIAAMTDCKVDAKWIDDLTVNYPEEHSVIILNLDISGDFALFFEDDECQMWK